MAEQLTLGGPYLAVAVLCEKILEEKDGVHSLIRIVDRVSFRGEMPSMPPNQLSLMLAIFLRSGVFRGTAQLEIEPITPSGKPMPAMRLPVLFEGDDDRGVAVALQLQFVATEEGLYWFDIKLADMLLTRVPLRVVYLQAATIAGNMPTPPQSRS